MVANLISAARTFAFVYLSAFIVVVASERAYWYFTGYDIVEMLGLALAYAIPVSIALLALGATRAHRAYQVVMAGAIFAWAVEGILTPVVYSDGFLPVFALMFLGWHGLLAFFGFWYLARKWLVDRATGKLAVGGALTGVFWGVWAYVSTAGGETDLDLGFSGGVDSLMAPTDFAVYAGLVGLTLVIGHLALGLVWPKDFVPSKTYRRTVYWIGGGYFILAVVWVVFWAPLKLAILFGGAYWLMRPVGEHASGAQTVFTRLSGTVRIRDAMLLLTVPALAIATYAAMWELGVDEATSAGGYELLAISQVAAGLIALVWAVRRSRRTAAGANRELSRVGG